METLEIHSKSFLIKWVQAPGNSTISWQVKPTKKSINFGLCRHNRDGSTVSTSGISALPLNNTTSTGSSSVNGDSSRGGSVSSSSGGLNNTSNNAVNGGTSGSGNHSRKSISSASGSTLEEKLANSDLEKVTWHGRCEPGELLAGSFFVTDSAGGTYALVFDNMFSKNTAKTVLFSQQVVLSADVISSSSSFGSLTSSMTRQLSVSESAIRPSSNLATFTLRDPSSSVTPPQLRSASVSTATTRRLSVYANPSAAAAAAAVAAASAAVSSSGGQGGSPSSTSANVIIGGPNGSLVNGTIANTSTGAPPLPKSPVLKRGRSKTTGSTKGKGGGRVVSSSNPGESTEVPSTNGDSSKITNSSSAVGSSVNTPSKPTWISTERYMTGTILKKRRKKLQGYGRRYFSLDRKYGLLNYYFDQKSSLLRGSMPIRLCVITAIQSTREIVIDSGMEVWNLKAQSVFDWKAWVAELDALSRSSAETTAAAAAAVVAAGAPPSSVITPMGVSSSGGNGVSTTGASAENSWSTLNDLVDRLNSTSNLAQTALSFSSTSPALHRRPSFWKRKKSSTPATGSPPNNTSSEDLNSSSPPSPDLGQNPSQASSRVNAQIQDSFQEVSNQLSSLLSDFQLFLAHRDLVNLSIASNAAPDSTSSATSGISSAVTANNVALVATSRTSFDGSSTFSEDMFFDAPESLSGGVVYVDYDYSDNDNVELDRAPEQMVYYDEVNSDDEDEAVAATQIRRSLVIEAVSVPVTLLKEQDLYPLPISYPVQRRYDIPEATTTPPSLIGLLRKNVGKDLTTVAMPVSCNEPLTILEKLAEIVEYSGLLDQAANAPNPNERALLVATFAVSYMASQRSKERALRKPFNPLLGETYELVREDRGFRLIAEKVSHRPPIMAVQVESVNWTIHYTARPHQKYWGKSVELTDSGPVRVYFNKTGDVFQYLQPSTFLRNIIAGEKYVEPVGSVTVESSHGGNATIEYKAGGMFSGRSEELSIKAYDTSGRLYSTSYEGKWTEQITTVGYNSSNKKVIWKVGNLVPRPQKKYGFTEWAASLNEITEIEKNKIPPTDSRLRPDQSLYENGITEEAETRKLDLEERQRQRRKIMEDSGETWKPIFFDEPSDSDLQYFTLKSGPANYWERRKEQNWDGLTELW